MLRAVRERRVEAVASWDLAREIADVLRRPKARRAGISERDIVDVLILLARFLPDVEIDLALRDPNDAPVVAAAVVGRADAIVTGDRGLLDDADLRAWLRERSIEVLAPAELLERLG